MSESFSNSAPSDSDSQKCTRRILLGQVALGATCGLTGLMSRSAARVSAGDDASAASQSTSKAPETPDEAMKLLTAGNRRFAEGQSLSSNRDMNRVRRSRQWPKAVRCFPRQQILRVPIEIVFDQGFGDLFVTLRIAGNVASSENIGSLEFGTKILGAKVLYVLGHTSCGAVAAMMKGDEVPDKSAGCFSIFARP
ncbi:MAG: carbonic anhydrase [Planctomycetaceae bacterium]